MNSTVGDSSSKTSRTYTYSSPPRALSCQRRRYRDNLGSSHEKLTRCGNIMHDRRVVRGNTYSLPSYQPICKEISRRDPTELQRQKETKRKALARKRVKGHLQPRTPEPVEGRRHVGVQTELYLEVLADRMIEVDKACQTEAFLDKPPTPFFNPVKIGQDAATQILEGELFSFDMEVQPMVEVLVAKIIEQALMEVAEEDELAEIQLQQQQFEELGNMELALAQRLEEQNRRIMKEKETRREQQLAVLQRQKEAAQKIAAHLYTKIYLTDLLPCVFRNLRDSGYFYDRTEREIEIDFLPSLMNEVHKKVEYNVVGRVVLDMLIREVVENRLNMFEQLGVKQSKSFPDENDKERKESSQTGVEPVTKDVKEQDSPKTNGSLKKPTSEKKHQQKKKREKKKKPVGKVPSDWNK